MSLASEELEPHWVAFATHVAWHSVGETLPELDEPPEEEPEELEELPGSPVPVVVDEHATSNPTKTRESASADFILTRLPC